MELIDVRPHHPATPDQRRDDQFGSELVRQIGRLQAYARRLTTNHFEADDLVQDTMVRCWAARHKFQVGSNLAAWTRTVMRNSFLSTRRRLRFVAELPPEAFECIPDLGSQEFAVELREVDRAFAKLSQEHRDVVLLASEGLSVDEAAAALAIPVGTFKSRVVRARRRLRLLTDEGRSKPAPRVEVDEPNPGMRSRRRRSWKGVLIG